MKKKLIYLFTIFLTTVGLIGLNKSIVEAEDKNNSNFTNNKEIIVGETTDESGQVINSVEEAIKNAIADYETLTTIYLKKDEQLTKDVTLVSGQNIEIKSQEKDFQIGQTDLGYTLTISNQVNIERQASLTLDTNVNLNGSSALIQAYNNNTNVKEAGYNDFNAELVINDSLTINGGTLDTDFFKNIDVYGTINLKNGIISGNEEISVNEEAGVVQIGGSITSSLVGDGIYVTTSDEIPNNSSIASKTGVKTLDSNSFQRTTTLNDTYILTDSDYSLVNNININSGSEASLIAFGDVKINVNANSNNHSFNVNGTFNVGGLYISEKFYSVGTNNLILDGGAAWESNDNGDYSFVTGKYEIGEDAENAKRAKYSPKHNSTQPLIKANENGTFNLYRNAILQNNNNNVTISNADSYNENIGSAIHANKATVNIYGGLIRYNALPNVTNGGGGAIAAYDSTIHMHYGEVNYNTNYYESGSSFDEENKSADGAGISLISKSDLIMDGGSISYNHGSKSYSADGAGIMVRNNSKLEINDGEVSYNFTYGYGGAICVWESTVTITNGRIIGNRATYGGGIATSAANNAAVTLGSEGEESNLEIANNTAYTPNNPGDKDTGYGGGIDLGNSLYKENQTLTIYSGDIHDNTAVYGGGISVYGKGSDIGAKLYLKGGNITNNKANSSNNGNGIYVNSVENVGTNSLVYMSESIKVDTSNNIVFADLDSQNISDEISNDDWNKWEVYPSADEATTRNFNNYISYTYKYLDVDEVKIGPFRTADVLILNSDGRRDGKGNEYLLQFEVLKSAQINLSFAKTSDTAVTFKITDITENKVIYENANLNKVESKVDGWSGWNTCSINLVAGHTYKLEALNNEVAIHTIYYDLRQVPIIVEDTLTATGAVGLITYADSNQYNTHSTLAYYLNETAQDDKFIIDNANYKVEASNNVVSITTTGQTNNIVQVNGKQFNNLGAAIKYINNKTESTDFTIEVLQNINLTTNDFITIPTGKNVTITSVGSEPYTLNIPPEIASNGEVIFNVSKGSSLTLSNIIFEGGASKNKAFVVVENNGTFTLDSDAIINNNLAPSDYATIEVGRGETTTNIEGQITNNKGDYGAIYLSNSEAILNVNGSAIITNNTYTGNTTGLEEVDNVDIYLESGTLNIDNFTGEIGTIVKQGTCTINASGLNNSTPIGILVSDVNYKRNEVIVNVNGNNDYSNNFKLIQPHNDLDGLMVESSASKNLVLNMVLTIEISFSDIWEDVGNGNYKKIDSAIVESTNYNTLAKLTKIKETLGLNYDIDYRAGSDTLIFYIDSTKNLNFANLISVGVRPGYSLNGFVRHAENAKVNDTSSEYFGMQGFISVQNFTSTTEHIYLGTVWKEETYILEFNNGGLSTANQNMENQEIPFSSFDDGKSVKVNTNNYYAVGFYFKGWRVLISTGNYVKSNGKDLVISNNGELNGDIISTIKSQVNSNTFVLEAYWGFVFDNGGSYNEQLKNVGNSANPFEIANEESLERLAKTVDNGDNSGFTIIDSEGTYNYYNISAKEYENFDYSNYYFTLTANISNFNMVIGNITDRDEDFFESSESEKPIADMDILNNSTPFSGKFDGNNKTISVNINDTNNIDFVGLFGYTKDATITNLTVTGSVNGRISVGGIIGLAYGGNYRNLTNEATIHYNGINAGGIMGTYYIESQNYRNGSINNVVNKAEVKYVPEAGDPETTNVIYGPTWAENEILFAYQGTRAGGIVGQSFHVNITEAYNSGNIEARLGVGGIIGTMISQNDDTREDSALNTGFNAGNITATAGLATTYEYNGKTESIYQVNAYVGGIVGRMFGASTLNNAMNIGSVEASWVGTYTQSENSNPTFTYNSEQPTIGGRGVGGIVGVTSIDLTVEQMQDPSTRASEQQGGNKTVSNVINAGKVSGWTHVGGIAGILAYSDLSYAINVGSLTATGVHYENDKAVVGAFSYDVIDGENSYYNFLGGLIGLGVSANVNSTSVFDGDLAYNGYTDSIIQAIGDKEEAIAIGYDTNNDNALKLASSHLICQPNNKQPIGLDSTFFQTGWIWLSYDTDKYYYYPQLVSFANSSKMICSNSNKKVSELSKEAVRLTDIKDKPVDEEHTVTITLELGNGSINHSGPITTTDGGAEFALNAGIWKTTINYLEYRGDGKYKMLNLDSLTEYLTLQAYDFAGWYRDSKFTEEFNGVVSLNDEVLYAKWVPTKYTITLTGVQKYANGDVQIAGSNLITYDIEDVEAKKEFVLPGIVNNKAYRFLHWEISSGGNTYNATSLRIEQNEDGTYQVRLYLNNNESGNFRITELGTLDFTLVCEAINYQIDYELIDNKDNAKIVFDEIPLPTSFNINSNFKLEGPSIPGYDFVEFVYNNEAYTNISEIIALGFDDLDANTPIVIQGKYNRAKYTISLILNNGTFNNINSGTIIIGDKNYQIKQAEDGLWQIIDIEYKEDISFLWKESNFSNYIIAPAGSEFVGLSSSNTTSEEKYDKMPSNNINVYAKYDVTTYEITLDAGSLGDKPLSFKAEDADISNLLEYSSGTLILTATYGSDISDILEQLVNILVTRELNNSNYNFNSFNATYKVGSETKNFSYYNVRIDEENYSNIKIEFIFKENVYNIAIFDNLGNYITNYSSDADVDWLDSGNINIPKFKEYLSSLNYELPAGYNFNNHKFTIRINNELAYDVDDSKETILVNGYTVISIILEPKEYTIKYQDSNGNLYETAPTVDKLIYNGQVNTSDLYQVTQPGYNFIGWQYNGEFLGKTFIPTEEDINKNSINLKAVFEEASYEITFEFNADTLWGGVIPRQEITVVYGANTITLANYFNLEGYNFVSASYSGNTITEINKDFLEKLAELREITITINLEIEKLHVTFSAGDGYFEFNQNDLDKYTNSYYLAELGGEPIKNNPSNDVILKYFVVEINYFESAARYLPTNPIKVGSSFSNWSSQTSGVVLQQQLKEDTTFNANYVEDKYTITLINDGEITTIDNLVYGQIYNLSTLAKVGYTFKGWYDVETDIIVEQEYQVTKNVVLEARYDANNYELTITTTESIIQNAILNVLKGILNNEDNEELTWNDGKFSIPYGTDLTALNGLIIEENKAIIFTLNGEAYSFGNMPAGKLSIEASVKDSEYITIKGTISGFANNESKEITFIAVKREGGNYYISSYEDLVFEGYTFDNKWSINGTYINITEYAFTTDNTDITANVERIELTISIVNVDSYDKNKYKAYYGETVEEFLKRNNLGKPTRPGYAFTGWSYYGDDYKITANITLEANYDAVNYFIEYVDAEGQIDSKVSVAYGEEIGTLPSIQKEVYEYLTYVVYGTNISYEVIFPNGVMVDLSELMNDYSDAITKDNEGNITIKIQIKKNEKKFILNVIGSNVSGNQQTDSIEFTHSELPEDISGNQINYYNYLGLANSLDGDVISDISYDDLIQLFKQLDLNNNNPEVSVDVYFIYGAIEYSISFEGYDELDELPFTYEDDYVTIPNEYLFEEINGWKVNDKVYRDAFDVSELLATLTGDSTIVTVVADFKTYDVLFYYGNNESILNVSYGTTYAELYELFKENHPNLVDLEKTGYIFDGWYDYNNNKLVENDYEHKVTKFITFSPKFNPITYTVSFDDNVDDNSVTGQMNLMPLTYDVAKKLTTNAFERKGYKFLGWAVETDGNVIYTDGQSVINLASNQGENVTLYAVWEANVYTISFITDGGSTINSISFTIENRNDIDLTNYVPTKLGYDFAGWYVDNTEVESINELKDYSLEAHWSAKEYKITFADAEVTGDKEIKYTYNTELSLPDKDDVTHREGYTFKGWNYDTMEEIAKYADDENKITLTAIWQANTYTINYEVNNTYGSIADTNVTVDYDEVVTLPTVTANSGFTFMYWSLNGTYYTAGTKVSKLTTKESVTLKAVFSYKITFDGNVGTGSVDSITGLIEDKINGVVLPNNGFVREHYIFVGWSTKSNPSADDKIYQPGELYKDLDKPLYAIWEAESYTITYVDNEGNTIGHTTYSYSEEKITLLGLPSIPGYDVSGWYKGEDEFKYSQGLFGDIQLSYKTSPKSIITTINISGLDENSLEEIKKQIEAKDTNDVLKIEIDDNILIITLTNTYAAGDRNIINTIFSENYTYIVSDVTYTLFPITINKTIPTENETYNYSFTKTSIVVHLYGVYGHYDMGEEPTSNIITLGQYEVNNANFILSEDDIKPYLKDIYGYSFVRWYFINDLDKAENFDFNTHITESINLYAEYDADKFSISYFDGDDVKTHYDASLTIKEAASKPGYKFIGYALSPNGLVVLNPGDSVNKAYDLMNKEDSNITLYPIYEANTLTIKFDSNNASGNMPNLTFAYNEFNIDDLRDISSGYYLEGYSFAGWTYILDGKEYNITEFSNVLLESLNNGNVIITLKANWKVNTYTIIYVDADMESTKHEYDSPLTLDRPTRVGYTFAGWYLDSSYSKEFNYENMPAKDLILYAKWNPISYNVVFNSNGGFGTMNSLSLNYDEPKKLTKNSFTREGYKFVGWSTEANGSIVYNDEDTVINLTETSSNIILYAVWEANTYTVIFNGNGGIGNMDNQSFTYGEAKELTKNSFTKGGYTFIGWSTSRDGNVVYTDCLRININADITLYAVWEANEYQISFDTFDYEELSEPKPITIKYGEIITKLPDLELASHRFIGWFINDKQVVDGEYYLYDSNITLKPKFETIKDSFNIFFDTNGGTILNSQALPTGSNVNISKIPTKEGYIFSHFEVNGKEYYVENLQIKDFVVSDEDVTFKAIYTPIEYTVILVFGDKKFTYKLTYDEFKVLPTYNELLNDNEITDKEGHRFIGYIDKTTNKSYGDGATLINLTNKNNDTIILTAQYEVNEYQIVFDTNGASSIDPISVEFGTNVSNAIQNTLIKSGYRFIGWAYNDEVINNEFTMPAENITLEAVWEIINYNITYNLNDGINSSNPNSYNVENIYILAAPHKAGYEFEGWYLDSNYNTQITSTAGYTKDLVLYAKWSEPINYNIVYNLNGGINDSSNPNSYTVEDNITLREPTRVGYTFVGWYNDNTKIETISNLTGDLVLEAKWEVITYTISFDTKGGNDLDNITYSVQNIPTLPIPTKPGYEFAGWYNGDTPVTDLNGHYEDLTLTAHWSKALEYNIIYNLNGGTNNSDNPNSYTVNDSITLGEPTRVGYKFLGWYKGNIKIETISNLTGDLVLEAKWEVMSYTISYDTTLSDMVLESKTIEYGASFGDLVNPLELEFGLKFVGWYYNDTLITKDMIFNYESDITLTAKVEDAIYNVVYDTNGGINSENNKTTISVKEDVPFILNPAKKTGYKFIGWSLKDGTIVKEINKDVLANATNYVIELKAEYEVNTFTVTYVDTDGNVLKTITNVPYGSMATTFTPTKDGYIFDAWYKDGSIYDFNTPITDNLTLVAMYKIREVSITVNINGEDIKVTVTSVDGTGLQADTNISIILVENETNLDIVSQLLNDFGVLSRLYEIKLVDSKGNEIVPTSEIRVSLSLPNETLASDKTYTIVNVADDFSGYEEFKADINGDNISFYTTHFSYYGIVITDKVLDLTWLWILLGVVGFLLIQVVIILVIKNRKYHIRFITKGDIKVKELKYKKNEYIALPKPKRLGYRFVGWYLDREFKYPANMKTMPNENLVLYARWVKDPINIGFVVKK